jgi:NADPH2:quinone reductase
MAFDGRWIMIATLAGDIGNIDMRMMYVRGTRLIGTTLRRRTSEAKAKLLADMVELIWPKIEDGTIRPTIFKVFPIQEAEDAHQLMYSCKSAGKIVLTVDEQEC